MPKVKQKNPLFKISEYYIEVTNPGSFELQKVICECFLKEIKKILAAKGLQFDEDVTVYRPGKYAFHSLIKDFYRTLTGYPDDPNKINEVVFKIFIGPCKPIKTKTKRKKKR